VIPFSGIVSKTRPGVNTRTVPPFDTFDPCCLRIEKLRVTHIKFLERKKGTV